MTDAQFQQRVLSALATIEAEQRFILMRLDEMTDVPQRLATLEERSDPAKAGLTGGGVGAVLAVLAYYIMDVLRPGNP